MGWSRIKMFYIIYMYDRFIISIYKVEINNEIRDLIVVKTSKQDEKTSRPNEDFNLVIM